MGKITGGELGNIGSYELDWANNALQIALLLKAGPLQGTVALALPASEVILLLEHAIKNETVDGLLEGLRKLLVSAPAPVPPAA